MITPDTFILTTEDGVNLHIDTNVDFWAVYLHNPRSVGKYNTSTEGIRRSIYEGEYAYFLDKEKAAEYVLENADIFSSKDFLNLIPECLHDTAKKELLKLARANKNLRI